MNMTKLNLIKINIESAHLVADSEFTRQTIIADAIFKLGDHLLNHPTSQKAKDLIELAQSK